MPGKLLKKRKPLCQYGPTNIFFINSPLGRLEMICCPNGIHSLTAKPENIQADINTPVEFLSQEYCDNGYTYKPSFLAVDWLKLYFTSPKDIRQIPHPPICSSLIRGSFQDQVWECLLENVPVGQTVTYAKLAEMLDNPGAVRAVGTALKNNSVMLIIPCHRVTKSDGTYGLFTIGTKVKEWLVLHEKKAGES